MTSNLLVSPRQLASAIGVSESSLKRWADEGLLLVSKTAGGHRRISITAAIRFIRERQLELVRPDILGLPAKVMSNSEVRLFKDPEKHLADLFINARLDEAELFITSRFLAGDSVAVIADGMIRHALAEVGELWNHRGDGIVIEHRATDTCLRGLMRIRSLMETPENAPISSGGGLQDDPYILPSLVASLVAVENGLTAKNLGPNTPIDSMKIAADTDGSSLFWITVSNLLDRDQTRKDILDLQTHLGQRGCVLVIGGRHAHQLDLPSEGNRIFCSDMVEFAEATRNIAKSNPR